MSCFVYFCLTVSNFLILLMLIVITTDHLITTDHDHRAPCRSTRLLSRNAWRGSFAPALGTPNLQHFTAGRCWKPWGAKPIQTMPHTLMTKKICQNGFPKSLLTGFGLCKFWEGVPLTSLASFCHYGSSAQCGLRRLA